MDMTAGQRRVEAHRRLSADDWTRAALTAIAESGIEGVAIEPLAKRLGATKGSFYWHFANRDALIAAALNRWERECTDEVIDAVSRAADPVARLRVLAGFVLQSSRNDEIELALLATAKNPIVAAALARVTQRRVDYVAEQYRAAGSAHGAAHRRAILAVSIYLGHVQLARTAPGVLPADDEWQVHLQSLGQMLSAAG